MFWPQPACHPSGTCTMVLLPQCAGCWSMMFARGCSYWVIDQVLGSSACDAGWHEHTTGMARSQATTKDNDGWFPSTSLYQDSPFARQARSGASVESPVQRLQDGAFLVMCWALGYQLWEAERPGYSITRAPDRWPSATYCKAVSQSGTIASCRRGRCCSCSHRLQRHCRRRRHCRGFYCRRHRCRYRPRSSRKPSRLAAQHPRDPLDGGCRTCS